MITPRILLPFSVLVVSHCTTVTHLAPQCGEPSYYISEQPSLMALAFCTLPEQAWFHAFPGNKRYEYCEQKGTEIRVSNSGCQGTDAETISLSETHLRMNHRVFARMKKVTALAEGYRRLWVARREDETRRLLFGYDLCGEKPQRLVYAFRSGRRRAISGHALSVGVLGQSDRPRELYIVDSRSVIKLGGSESTLRPIACDSLVR